MSIPLVTQIIILPTTFIGANGNLYPAVLLIALVKEVPPTHLWGQQHSCWEEFKWLEHITFQSHAVWEVDGFIIYIKRFISSNNYRVLQKQRERKKFISPCLQYMSYYLHTSCIWADFHVRRSGGWWYDVTETAGKPKSTIGDSVVSHIHILQAWSHWILLKWRYNFLEPSYWWLSDWMGNYHQSPVLKSDALSGNILDFSPVYWISIDTMTLRWKYWLFDMRIFGSTKPHIW